MGIHFLVLQEGVNWLSFLNRYGLNGILCDDLGLGKTLQTICILAGSHKELQTQTNPSTLVSVLKSEEYVDDVSRPAKRRKKLSEPSLKEASPDSLDSISKPDFQNPLSIVVCPSTLCGHWLHEIQKFANPKDLKPMVYMGCPAVRQR